MFFSQLFIKDFSRDLVLLHEILKKKTETLLNTRRKFLDIMVYFLAFSYCCDTSPHVRESKTVLDCGLQAGDPGFYVLDSSLCQ